MGKCELTTLDEREFLKNLFNHNNLRDIFSNLGMSLSTAFNWRHKMLTPLKDYYEKNNIFSGLFEVDEIYFPLSFSGNSNALKNLNEKKRKTNNESPYLIYRPRKKLISVVNQ